MNGGSDPKQLAGRIARRIASGHVDPEVVKNVAHELAARKFLPKRIDICQYGICWDHVIGVGRVNDLLGELLQDVRIGKIEVFPWGIPVIDEVRLRVEQRFEVR